MLLVCTGSAVSLSKVVVFKNYFLFKMLMNVWMQARIIAVLMPTVLIPLEVMSVPVYLDILVMAFFVVVSILSHNFSFIMVVRRY